jgi:hypothetical protein
MDALHEAHIPKPPCLPLYVAIFTQIKRQFAEGAETAEVIEAAERRLFGLRLEVVEAPLLKIEAAVDQGGRVAAVRCRAALDLEAVYVGAAPGYRLEKTAQAGRQPTRQRTSNVEAASCLPATAGVEAKKAAGWGACWKR